MEGEVVSQHPALSQSFRNGTVARAVVANTGSPVRGAASGTPLRASERSAFVNESPHERFQHLFSAVVADDPDMLESYFGESQREPERTDRSSRMSSFLVSLAEDSELKECLELAIVNENDWLDDGTNLRPETNESISRFLELEKRTKLAYRVHKDRFPSEIWHCCQRFCFTNLVTDPLQYDIMNELIIIHQYAEKCHKDFESEKNREFIEANKHAEGTSTVSYRSLSLEQREAACNDLYHAHGTRRQEGLREFARFVVEILPFLYGKGSSACGTVRMKKKICTQAICCLLGVSRNFLYSPKRRKCIQRLDSATEDELESLIDSADVRLRQLRRTGNRGLHPPLQNLRAYECGCDTPCFSDVHLWSLVREYNGFIKFAKELKPRHKENCYLLNRLYCPLSRSTTQVCNRALSALYTVSEALVADVRMALDAMCQDPAFQNGEDCDSSLLDNGVLRYRYDRSHPINRYPKSIREKVEGQLDMVIRADPAGSNGDSVCRVYSPEINTQEKLRDALRKAMEDDDTVDSKLSGSTLQRMVKDYLERRNYTISFTQSDHNACPKCKTLQYAVLQYHHEAVVMEREREHLLRRPRPRTQSEHQRLETLTQATPAKFFQEEECVNELNVHNSRDGRIRGYVRLLSDHFILMENTHRAMNINCRRLYGSPDDVQWNMFPDRACISHQDDMSKVNLPHFVVTASSDITRWRFDVNGHVSAVTKDAVILSHEQGTGPKNASAILEEILLHHLLTCRGEAIKIILSDNAAVGKNWLTTVALPQYMVDQGMAEVVVVIFLENNHGKYLADQLFGQFQSRRRREAIFSIDDMLSCFERINRKTGNVQGFAVNPLSSIDFAKIFHSLGYETKPPPDFGFVKRNIHIAAACKAGAKNRLPLALREIIQPALPDDAGMVRISTEPPSKLAQCQLRYEDRYFDVPAARFDYHDDDDIETVSQTCSNGDVPLVVPLHLPYASSGSGVVSARTAAHVGYNGIEFRKSKACPEMKELSRPIVRRAWPKGLVEVRRAPTSEEPVANSESVKCAPLNWILRRPVKHFCQYESDWKARYPPRNLLNAKFKHGPRVESPRPDIRWTPTATYHEPPFPVVNGTAACSAMKSLATEHQDISQSVHFLHALRAVYREMGDRDDVSDPWLQNIATIPAPLAIERFRYELGIYKQRESGHPKGPKTLRQAFREDENVLEEVSLIMERHDVQGQLQRNMKNQVLKDQFTEAENTPGALERFRYALERDQERYAREMQEFRKKQEQFDKDNGLSPTE